MTVFRADLHVHTVLSPCGDLDMSPVKIIDAAAQKGLDIIGITDHNCTRHCGILKKIARRQGIFVLQGAEVTTREEVHCLVFFEDKVGLALLQKFLNENLPDIKNDPIKFGYQVQVDENDIIVYEEEKLLINALDKSLEEVETFVHDLGGIFIPAHIDRQKNSVFSQLGFLPPDLKVDALEISKRTSISDFRAKHPELGHYRMLTCSDAHYLQDIGSSCTLFEMEKISFQEIRMTIAGINGRKIIVE
jgi:3',5'-nucleoside bisphosphate phosphatase